MKIFYSLSFIFLASLGAYAEELITVTVTGLGSTVEGVRKSAIQKAVRKALGEVVDAETIAQNGELIKDEVITYSDGFISKTFDISGPEKDPDLGLFTLTIQAEVIRSKVVKRLKEVNIKVVEIDGNSLYAQALSKMEKAQGGQQLLAKVLNEDLDPAKLIKCENVALDADGKLIRGKEAMTNPDALKVLDDERVELTMYWEISVDLEAYYKRALPRLKRVIDQVSKRQISRSTKRVMDANDAWDRNLEYHNYLTKRQFMWEDDYAILSYNKGFRVSLGKEEHFKIDLTDSGVSKDSPWRLDSRNKSILLAIELRGNADRSQCDFDIYELDYEAFSNVLFKTPAIVFPDFKFSILDRNQEVMRQRKISVIQTNFGPKGHPFLMASNQNNNISTCIIPTAKIPKGKNKFSRELMGIAKVYQHYDQESPYCVTISPEFITENASAANPYSDPYRANHQDIFLNNSIVMQVKVEFTKEQLQKLSEIRMQPISRNPNE